MCGSQISMDLTKIKNQTSNKVPFLDLNIKSSVDYNKCNV